MRCVVVCLCLVCLFPAMIVAGPLYKWVDDKGVIHYSDRHPGSSANVKNFEDRSYPDPKLSQEEAASGASSMSDQGMTTEEPEVMAEDEDETVEATDETNAQEDNTDLDQQEPEDESDDDDGGEDL